MAASPQEDQTYLNADSPTVREIILPDGYELAFFTLRRRHDGHLEPFKSVNEGARTVQAVLINTPLSTLELLRETQQDHTKTWCKSEAEPFSLASSSNQVPWFERSPKKIVPRETKAPSAKTVKRRANICEDEYTVVCGIYSAEISTPIKRYNHGKGEFVCPRCLSNFTRPYTVKEHFPDCIVKYGNPDALRFTDHTSMAATETGIERRAARARREASMVESEDDTSMDTPGQESSIEEMNHALAHTNLRSTTEEASSAYDGVYIKPEPEFVFGADVPRESIEDPQQQHQSGLSPRKQSVPRQMHTPFWAKPPGESPRQYASTVEPWTPAPQTPREQTPTPTTRDGRQDDGLDDYMDRRSQFSPTPVASNPPQRLAVLHEDYEMED